MLLVLWCGTVSWPAASFSFIVSYKKKSINMALTLASGCVRRISLRKSSTHQILQALNCISQTPPTSNNRFSLIATSKGGL